MSIILNDKIFIFWNDQIYIILNDQIVFDNFDLFWTNFYKTKSNVVPSQSLFFLGFVWIQFKGLLLCQMSKKPKLFPFGEK